MYQVASELSSISCINVLIDGGITSPPFSLNRVKQTKTLLISRNEQLYIFKEVENQYVCHDLSV